MGKVLDPCCGTGNFLLQLPESVDLADIYGTDTDAVSIRIARLNMALKYPDADVEEICRNILQRRIFSQNMTEQDLIPSLEIRRGAMLFPMKTKQC